MKNGILIILAAFGFVIRSHAQRTSIVEIINFSFVPDTIFIYKGDKVMFKIESDHTATQVDRETYTINEAYPYPGGFDLNPSSDRTITFNTPDTVYYVCKPHAGAGMKGIVIIKPQPLGFSEDSEIFGQLSIFPNPANNSITIQLPGSFLIKSIQFFDMDGKEAAALPVNGETSSCQLQVPELKKGMYRVVTSTEAKEFSAKVLIL